MTKQRFGRPVIGVMGGADVEDDVLKAAEHLGRAIAKRGWILLTGGRDAGVMAAASRGASDAGGFVVGILPSRDGEDGCPVLDLAICTGMGDARNLINVLTADVIIALAGGMGTLSEIALALKAARPVITLGAWSMETNPMAIEHRLFQIVATTDDALAAVNRILQKGKYVARAYG
ncbi:MAG: TIGR00725 family protein [Phycisphaerae bacterium]